MFLMRQFSYKFFYWLKNFPQNIVNRLQLNLFIILTCAPLFIFWGLHVSVMSILGNIIFMPILTIFLLISVIIFFLELFNLPNSWLILVLERVVNIFSFILNKSSSNWLINFKLSQMGSLLAVSIFIFIIAHLKSTVVVYRSVICFCCMYFVFYNFNALFKNQSNDVKYLSPNTFLISYKTSRALIDAGDLFKSPMVSRIRQEGISKLDYLIILNPGTNILKSIVNIINNFKIQYLILPNWDGKMTNIGWGAWLNILELSMKNNIKIVALGSSEKIYLGENAYLAIESSEENILKNNLKYKKIKLKYLIDDKKILELN